MHPRGEGDAMQARGSAKVEDADGCTDLETGGEACRSKLPLSLDSSWHSVVLIGSHLTSPEPANAEHEKGMYQTIA